MSARCDGPFHCVSDFCILRKSRVSKKLPDFMHMCTEYIFVRVASRLPVTVIGAFCDTADHGSFWQLRLNMHQTLLYIRASSRFTKARSQLPGADCSESYPFHVAIWSLQPEYHLAMIAWLFMRVMSISSTFGPDGPATNEGTEIPATSLAWHRATDVTCRLLLCLTTELFSTRHTCTKPNASLIVKLLRCACD